MMPRKNAALILLVVGLLLLPGPAYAIGLDRLDGPDRTRSPTGYVATPINGSNDTVLAEKYGNQVSFQIEDMQYGHIADDYRAPNRTRSVLEAAVANQSARTSDPAVKADLRTIERRHAFVTEDYHTYYDLVLNRSGDTMQVRAVPASDSAVAAVVRDQRVVAYENLSAAEQQTFRKIRNATVSGDDYNAYRPWSDEPMPDKPIVVRNGNYYQIRGVLHVDDFGFPTGFFIGFAASGVGIICLLGAAGIGLYRWIRGRGE